MYIDIRKIKKDIKTFQEQENSPRYLDLMSRIYKCIVILDERNKEKSAKIEVLKEVLTNK